MMHRRAIPFSQMRMAAARAEGAELGAKSTLQKARAALADLSAAGDRDRSRRLEGDLAAAKHRLQLSRQVDAERRQQLAQLEEDLAVLDGFLADLDPQSREVR